MSYHDHWRGSVEDRLAAARAALPKLEARIARLEALLSAVAAAKGGSGGGGGTSAAVTTAPLSAGGPAGPGFGTAQVVVRAPSGDYADSGPTITVLNAGAAVGQGVRGLVHRDAAGSAWFSPEECG